MTALIGATSEQGRISEMCQALPEDSLHAVYLFVQALFWCRTKGQRAREFARLGIIAAKALFECVSKVVEVPEAS